MPATLKEDRWDQALLEQRLTGYLERGSVLHKAISAILRSASTMQSGEAKAHMLKGFLRFAKERDLDVLTMNRDDIEEWVGSLRHLAPTTLKPRLGQIRQLYDELLEREAVKKNPARRVKLGRYTQAEVAALTLEQAQRVIDDIRAELGDRSRRLIAARDYLIFALAFTCGPRRSELRRLTVADFDLGADVPVAHIYGKFRRHESKPLAPIVIEAFQLYRQVLEGALGRPLAPQDAVLLPLSASCLLDLRLTRGPLQPMSAPALYLMVRNRLRDAGIDGHKLGTHRLRKTAATLAWLNKSDPNDIRAMLGHSKLSTTLKSYIAPEEDPRRSPALTSPLRPAGFPTTGGQS